jgi:hypothetical protein
MIKPLKIDGVTLIEITVNTLPRKRKSVKKKKNKIEFTITNNGDQKAFVFPSIKSFK